MVRIDLASFGVVLLTTTSLSSACTVSATHSSVEEKRRLNLAARANLDKAHRTRSMKKQSDALHAIRVSVPVSACHLRWIFPHCPIQRCTGRAAELARYCL